MTKYILVIVSVIAFQTKVLAYEEYEDFEYSQNYDEILSELGTSETYVEPERDPFESVKIHAGVAFVNTVFTMDTPCLLYTSPSPRDPE